MRLVLSTFALSGLAAGCGVLTSSNGSEGFAGRSDNAGLALTTSDYVSSTLWYNDFATGELRKVLTGESGDPLPRWTGDTLYFFNRTDTSLNLRTVDPRVATPAATTQIATPAAKSGDPHDALLLSEGRLLLAHYVAGKLVVVNPADGTVVQDVVADFDLNTGDKLQLRPEAMWDRKIKGVHWVYVLNQALDGDYAQTGGGAVFVFKDDGSQLTAVDMDPAKDKVQGIPLTISNPSVVMQPDSAFPYVAGLCFGTGCVAGVQRLDLDAGTAEMTWDLSASGYTGNGGIVEGDDGTAYALLVKGTDKVVTKIDYEAQTLADVHKFPAESSGCCALFYDRTGETLIVGDKNADGTGLLSIYREGAATPEAKTLEAPPYTGTFVPK